MHRQDGGQWVAPWLNCEGVHIGVAGGDAEPGVTDVARVMRHIGGIAAVPDVVISRSGEHWGPGEQPTNASVKIAIAKVSEDLLVVAELRAAGKLPQP